jgi:serine/threonine-protein phosphatase 6 regulatory ankyrin repeat subunit C
MLELVVSMGCDLHQKDNLKQTPLFYAARSGHCQLISLLLQNGLEVDCIDTYGQNPIYYSINMGHLAAT